MTEPGAAVESGGTRSAGPAVSSRPGRVPFVSGTGHPPVDSDEHRGVVDEAERVLLDPALEPVVEMVLRRVGADVYEAAADDGRVRFRRTPAGSAWAFEVVATEGRDPLGDQAVDRFSPVEVERAARWPRRTDNAYPHGYEQVAQLFDSPAAPDLCVIHTAAHYWGDKGGHVGEHGSLDVVQSRAPFLVAGAGVRHDGLVDRSCRLVDIAPTVLSLLGAEAGVGIGQNGRTRHDAYLARQDGEVVEGLSDGALRRPSHAVGFLLDGANANVVHDLLARGEIPNIARLLSMGTAFGHGAMSSLPTVTLANHTSILTGAHPGHHGILHNAWWDRAAQRQVVTNSPATWLTAMETLDPGVETVHRAVHRNWPGELSVSVNEPCDAGADFSVFDLMRRGEEVDRPPPTAELPHATEQFVRPVKEYNWSSKVDHTGVEQAVAIWGGRYRGVDYPRPRFTWCNFTLTDAAFHEGGPHSAIAEAGVRDTDARIGEILAAVEEAGAFDDTLFFLTADHGMEEADPAVTGDWDVALDESGLAYRDEAFGFVYVNP
ncbi:MAG: alkaline phosphatase family protein [Acidimicrobiia bacterium]|nr:alkaline phosphatase family protein [Acidimicrobiia bacterium]